MTGNHVLDSQSGVSPNQGRVGQQAAGGQTDKIVFVATGRLATPQVAFLHQHIVVQYFFVI